MVVAVSGCHPIGVHADTDVASGDLVPFGPKESEEIFEMRRFACSGCWSLNEGDGDSLARMSEVGMLEDAAPVAGAILIYLGPASPHWEIRATWGDVPVVDAFRNRVNARLLLLPKHDPQFRRNRERVNRDAERELIKVEWDLGDDMIESRTPPPVTPIPEFEPLPEPVPEPVVDIVSEEIVDDVSAEAAPVEAAPAEAVPAENDASEEE